MKNLKFAYAFAIFILASGAASASVGSCDIHLGINAKGDLKTQEQTKYFEKVLESMPAHVSKRLILRVSGGTRSQKTFPSDWSDAQIDSWLKLQKKYHFRLIFVINGNDTPESQSQFIDRWIKKGANFALLEMMSEFYLPRFRKDIEGQKGSIHGKITPEIYTQKILPPFLKAFKSKNIPLYLIGAPAKPGNEYFQKWNQVVTGYIKSNQEFKFGFLLHLYKKNPSDRYDYDQIARVRASLPPSTPIAVTESGILPNSGQIPLSAIVAHFEKIYEQLHPGDFLIDQVLYSDYPNDQVANINPRRGGVTPKGKVIFKTIEDKYSKCE